MHRLQHGHGHVTRSRSISRCMRPSAASQHGGSRRCRHAAALPTPSAVPRRSRTMHTAASAAVTATAVPAPAHTVMGANVPRGETAGAVMVIDGVTIQAGERDLLQDVEWRLMPGHRVGLVGANGAGKSTLLRAMAGLRTVRDAFPIGSGAVCVVQQSSGQFMCAAPILGIEAGAGGGGLTSIRMANEDPMNGELGVKLSRH